MCEEEMVLPVTSVKIKRVSESYSCVLAYVTIGLANCIAIHNIKILEVKDKHTKQYKKILAFPNQKVADKTGNGNVKFTDIVHPTNSGYRKYLENIIFKLYEGGINND